MQNKREEDGVKLYRSSFYISLELIVSKFEVDSDKLRCVM